MILKTLEISNYRCFGKATFNFNPEFNLIVGKNGCGKSSLIETIQNCIQGFAEIEVYGNRHTPIIKYVTKDELGVEDNSQVRCHFLDPYEKLFSCITNESEETISYDLNLKSIYSFYNIPLLVCDVKASSLLSWIYGLDEDTCKEFFEFLSKQLNYTSIYFVKEVLTFEDNKRRVSFSQLSFSEKYLFQIFGYICKKGIGNKKELKFPLNKIKGIVLIEDLGMCLDPKSQREIIPLLRSSFPKIQFICTSTSPECIGEIKADQIIRLEDFKESPLGYSFGLDTNSVLEYVLNMPSRNIQVEDISNQIHNCLDNLDLVRAKELIEKLVALLKRPHPLIGELETRVFIKEALIESYQNSKENVRT